MNKLLTGIQYICGLLSICLLERNWPWSDNWLPHAATKIALTVDIESCGPLFFYLWLKDLEDEDTSD